MTKNILLFTSDKIGDTGTVSWNFIFQDEQFEAFEKWPQHIRSNHFGLFTHDGGKQIAFNIFHVREGLFLAGPINVDGTAEQNRDIMDEFPEYCYMLCTTATAKLLATNLDGLDVKIDILHSDKVLTTSN